VDFHNGCISLQVLEAVCAILKGKYNWIIGIQAEYITVELGHTE